MANSRLCSIPDCGKPYWGRGYCSTHYQRWRRNGYPLAGRTPEGEPQRYLTEVVLKYDGDECLTWPYGKTAGYGSIQHNGRDALVSRIVCEEENGPPPTPEHQAAHLCGKGHEGCVTRKHLVWKTRLENQADKLIHGTMLRGERHFWAKITEAQAREILSLKGQMLQREIAERFGISRPAVGMIHRGKNWAWID